MNSLYRRLIQKIYERSYAQCSAAGGKKLYADCHTSGCGSAAGNQSHSSNPNMIAAYGFAMAFGVKEHSSYDIQGDEQCRQYRIYESAPDFCYGGGTGDGEEGKEVAVLASAISFFIMHTSIATMLSLRIWRHRFRKAL